MRTSLIFLGCLLACSAAAQESASFKLTERTFNSGGDPMNGVVLASTSFRITLDAIGDAVAGPGMTSASFQMDGGFVSGFPPPGEVEGLAFSDSQTLVWDPERSAGDYNLYRDWMGNLSSLGYGTCEQHDIPANTAIDTEIPPLGDGYFYLVTAENRIDEEGTKGQDSSAIERPNPAPCP